MCGYESEDPQRFEGARRLFRGAGVLLELRVVALAPEFLNDQKKHIDKMVVGVQRESQAKKDVPKNAVPMIHKVERRKDERVVENSSES